MITIITYTFDSANTLARLFVSLRNQTYRNFVWIILDDGSTDNTETVVKAILGINGNIDIIYKKYENQHKFLTVLDAIKMVKSSYFIIVEPSDTLPENSLEILINEVKNIPNQNEYISVMGLSAYENGKIIGSEYPNNGFDGSILEMRHKYKVRGNKFGIFITKSYHREIKDKDFSKYEDKRYIPQKVIYNDYDSKGIKTRFINKIVRFYMADENQERLISNIRWNEKNFYGLTEGYLSTLNCYGDQLFPYSKILIRNIICYQLYALKDKRKIFQILSDIKHPTIKLISFLSIPATFIYFKIETTLFVRSQ